MECGLDLRPPNESTVGLTDAAPFVLFMFAQLGRF
jgi:hypothetical protein